MKKFLAIFFILMAANISAANAEVVKISEIGVQQFINAVTTIIYSDEFQKEIPLLITDAVKIENTEMPEIGQSAFVCHYGLKTASAPDGEIIFFVDDEEKVSALKVVGYSNEVIQNSTMLVMISLRVLGLTQADAEFLVNNLEGEDSFASSIVWSNELNRCIVLMASARPQAEQGFQFTLMASDKKE